MLEKCDIINSNLASQEFRQEVFLIMRLRMYEEQCIELGTYMVQHRCTVRQVAEAKGIPKSTVHNRLTKCLPLCDTGLYASVRKILDKNKAERHIRGGAATKRKFAKRAKSKKRRRKKK